MTRPLLLAMSLVAALGACDPGTPKCDSTEPCTTEDGREQVDDRGEACLVDLTSAPYGTAITLEAGEAATVRVAFDNCAPCGEDLQSSCTVTREGATLRVEATASWLPLEGDCPAICQLWFTECTSGPLEEGDYTLVYGDGAAAFTVPVTGDLVCAPAG